MFVIWFKGFCYCGVVKFEVMVVIVLVVCCNCSLCCWCGVLMSLMFVVVNLMIVEGEGVLICYQFNMYMVCYYFCSWCGVYLFYQICKDLVCWCVNFGCFDGVDFYVFDVMIVDGVSFLVVEDV